MNGAFARSLVLVLVLVLEPGCSGGGGSSSGTPGPVGGTAAKVAQSGQTLSGQPLAPTKAKTATVLARSSDGQGWLEATPEGKHMLHVKGTPAEMGQEYGELLGGEIEDLLATLPAYAATQHFPAQLLPGISAAAAGIFWNYFPADVHEYLRGVVAGMQTRNPQTTIQEGDLIFLNSLVDLGGVTNGLVNLCSSVAVWGDRTVGGKMFQTRCIDLFIGSGLEDHSVLTIEKRDGKTPWANCAWSGMVGSASGMNAHGLAIGQVWAFSQDKQFGVPWVLTTRKIMEEGVDSEDAVAGFAAQTQRTYGANFVFGDKGDGRGGQPKAWAIEESAHYMATFVDDDPKELNAIVPGSNPPACYAIPMPFAVFRGDSCMDPGMRSRQTASNGPTGDPRGANAYIRRYKGQADVVASYEAQGIKIDAPHMIALTQQVATPGGSLQCCVYANSDLELWVADAHTDAATGASTDAFNRGYVHYDFDYYLPTVKVTLDGSSFAPGDALGLAVTTSTLGSDRDLDLSFRIEGPGGAVVVPANYVGPLAASFRKSAGEQTTGYGLVLPATIAAGSYRVVAELDERGTQDLVDMSVVPFTVR